MSATTKMFLIAAGVSIFFIYAYDNQWFGPISSN